MLYLAGVYFLVHQQEHIAARLLAQAHAMQQQLGVHLFPDVSKAVAQYMHLLKVQSTR